MRVRRRAKVRRVGYAPHHEFQLLTGHDFFGDAYGEERYRDHRWEGAFDAETARADWEDHRDDLVAYWTSDPAGWRPKDSVAEFHQAQPGGPGSRPAAWWWFDAPEPRRIVACWHTEGGRLVEIAADDVAGLDLAAWPRLWRAARWRHFFRGMRDPCPGIVDFETSRAYLARLDLMSAAERAALPAVDPEHDDEEDRE